MSIFTPFTFAVPEAAAAAGGPWSPSDNANLLAWYDAADTATVQTVGSNVSQWDDKSGNGYNATQGTATDRPGWGANQLNGYDVLQFAAGGGGGLWLNLPSTPYTDNNVSMYVVGRRTTSKTYGVAVGFHQGTSQYAVNILVNGDGQDYFGSYTNAWQPSSFTMINGDWYIMEMIGTYTTGTTWDINWYRTGNSAGGVTGTPTYTVFGPSSARIGSDEYGSYMIGDIAEIAFVNAKDSTTDRQKMEGYMAWKWGLEGDLPAGHPYKSAPPTT